MALTEGAMHRTSGAMHRCHVCLRAAAEGAFFARDRSKRGERANKCRDCNAAKCRRWYQAHRTRKIAQAQRYKAAQRQQWEARKWEMCRAMVDALTKHTGLAKHADFVL